MAYLDSTFLYNFQQTDHVQRELRTDKYGLIDAIKEDTPLYKALTPSLKAFIETQMNRTFYMPAIQESTITSLTAESFAVPANLSTSEQTTGTLVTLFSGFHWYDALSYENSITKEDYINNKLLEIFKSFALAKEATTYTFVDGKKSQVLTYNPASSDGITYAASTLTCTLAAQQQRIFQNLQTIGEANGMGDMKKFVCSPGIKVLQNFNDMYGQSNWMDLVNQGFIPKIYTSNRVTNSVRWTGYLWEEGSFAYVNNFKHDFVQGTQLFGGSAKWDVTAMAMPFINEQVMTYYEEDKADASALMTNSTSHIMTKVEKYGFIHRYVILGPYNSAIGSRFNPVLKVVGAVA